MRDNNKKRSVEKDAVETPRLLPKATHGVCPSPVSSRASVQAAS